MYLNEQKVSSLSSAAVLADGYVLTHETVFSPSSAEKSCSVPGPQPSQNKLPTPTKEDRECFYCHKTGHVIANCLALKWKEQFHDQKSVSQPEGIGLIKDKPSLLPNLIESDSVDECFKPFVFDRFFER